MAGDVTVRNVVQHISGAGRKSRIYHGITEAVNTGVLRVLP